ncbi:MAG: 4-hydroxy-tetrahydrodipicolinate synthase, partial [Phycisphaerales bacterium]|nr:4-hydroxy-tetrahydrodipicolinate synthase [Phycisphaerales bacterium]
REAESLGVDATLQVVPYYNRPSQEGLYRHFHAIADAADVPIVLYDVPSRTGVRMEVSTVSRLAAHPMIVAIKVASGNLDDISRLVRETDLAVLSGDDTLTLPIQCLGGVGVVSVISNLLPDQAQALSTAVNRGDLAAGRAIHDRLHPLSVGLGSLDSNPIPVKTAMALLGRDSGVVRPPLASLPGAATKELLRLLTTVGLEVGSADSTSVTAELP